MNLPVRRGHSSGGMRRSQSGDMLSSPSYFGGLCGSFTLQEEQLEVFQEFSRVMKQCSLAFLCVAASNIILTFTQACPLRCAHMQSHACRCARCERCAAGQAFSVLRLAPGRPNEAHAGGRHTWGMFG